MMKNRYILLLSFLIGPLIALAQDSELNPDDLIFNTTPVNPMISAHYGLNGLTQQEYYNYSFLSPGSLGLGDDLKWWKLNRDSLILNTALIVPLRKTFLELGGLTFNSRASGYFDTWKISNFVVNPDPPATKLSILHSFGEEDGISIYTQALSIDPSNRVAIGDIAATERLDVNGNARFRGVPNGSGNFYLRLNTDGSLAKVAFVSDARLKNDIETLDNALSKVLAMRGVSYTLKENPGEGIQHGLVAQELLQIVPELVNFDGEYYSINYEQLSGLFVEAIKEQQSIIIDQQMEIENLKNIASRINRLEKLMGVSLVP